MTSQFDLSDIETATLGHFLESGFMSPALQGLLPGRTVFGPALTVRMLGDDGAMLTEALSVAKPGQVIVIDRCGDLRHACWGAVTTAAAKARGVVGAVIDGFVTDRSAIEQEDFPVWCRGRSPITTKPRGLGGDFNVTVGCGGVSVRPGDIILADENGVAVLDKDQAATHAARARKMQEDEVIILERLRAGETLAEITRGAKQPA